MIRRVRVVGYKSLKDVEIRLQPLTVFIGPNGAGKSNLFDALGLLSRAVTSEKLGDAFKEHRGTALEAFCFRDKGLKGLLETPIVEFTIQVDVDLSPDLVQSVEQQIRDMRKGLPGEDGTPPESEKRRIVETSLRYALTVQMVTESGHLRVRDESLVALGKKGTPKAPHSRAAFIERVGNKLRLRMEGRGRPTYHDLGLDCTLVSTSPYPTYYPHITAFREELSRWGFYYFNPETMRAETPLKRAETLGPFGADLAAFYNTLRSANRPQFEAINRALRSLVPSVEKLDVERTPDGLLRLQVIENGVPFSASLISEGTLRVLGLLAITNPLGPTTVVGYEEPENGVHPRRLQLIAELLKNAAQSGKQILINTHSPKLPEYVEPASVVVCSRDERQTAFRPLANYGPLFRPEQIDAALQETPIEERVLRGDFGG